MTQPPTIRQITPVNAKTYDLEAPLSERRYEYLVARRDQMADRLRTGSLALNGSSLVALLATLSGDGTAAQWIGLTPSLAPIVATFFVIGAGLSGISIVLAGGQYATEAGNAFARMLAARRVAAAHEAPDTPSARVEATDALTAMHSQPLIDFQFSKLSIAFQSCGGAAWLAGMCLPLISKLFG